MAVKMASDGLWQGENPLDFALPLLAVLVVTQGLAFAFKPLRQPRVIAEILVFLCVYMLFQLFFYVGDIYGGEYNN